MVNVFFSPRDISFKLHLPDNTILSAKLCQDGAKALMSNPNKDLGKWLIRKVLHIPIGKIVKYKDLIIAGFDSVIVYKNSDADFAIQMYNSLSDFI